MPHTLPPLPYAYNALEPYINEQIMTLHHTKHHQTYVNALNIAEEQYAKASTPKERIALQSALKFNGGGKGPFSVVEKAVLSPDQSVPQTLLTKRSNSSSLQQVQELTVHTNFSKIESSQHGTVNFDILGTTHQGFLQSVAITPNISTEIIIDAFKDATDPFSVSGQTSIPTISSNASKTLLSEDFSCDGFDARASVMLQYELEQQMSLAIIASGSFSPPAVTNFIVLNSMSISLDLDVNAQMNALGLITLENTVVDSFPVPTFVIEGLIEIQPTFTIETSGFFNMDLANTLQFSYPVGLQSGLLIYPVSAGASSGTITKGPANAILTASPNENSDTEYAVELIPTLNLPVDILDVASANIALTFINTMSTELRFNATGDPDAFSGCFRLEAQFFPEGSADSTLGGALPNEIDALLSGVFRPIVGCFGGSTVFPIIPPSKRAADLETSSYRSREVSSVRRVSNKNLLARDFDCPPFDVSNTGRQLESASDIPI